MTRELKTVECYTHHVPAAPEPQTWAVRCSIVLHIEAATLTEARAEANRVMGLQLWLAMNQGIVRRKTSDELAENCKS